MSRQHDAVGVAILLATNNVICFAIGLAVAWLMY